MTGLGRQIGKQKTEKWMSETQEMPIGREPPTYDKFFQCAEVGLWAILLGLIVIIGIGRLRQ